jgi:hypothetical protein
MPPQRLGTLKRTRLQSTASKPVVGQPRVVDVVHDGAATLVEVVLDAAGAIVEVLVGVVLVVEEELGRVVVLVGAAVEVELDVDEELG